MVIAIDGPSGAGKSTVAQGLARTLGFTYLDTGAMYRAVALVAGNRRESAANVARSAKIVIGDTVSVDGEDVTAQIRDPEVSEAASRISQDPEVRSALVAIQRKMIQSGNWVAKGRDVGTVVAPQAEVKVFLTASPDERAKRRAIELGADKEIIKREQEVRDRRDSEREHSPLLPAHDAVPIDTTELTIDGVIGEIVVLVTEVQEIG